MHHWVSRVLLSHGRDEGLMFSQTVSGLSGLYKNGGNFCQTACSKEDTQGKRGNLVKNMQMLFIYLGCTRLACEKEVSLEGVNAMC